MDHLGSNTGTGALCGRARIYTKGLVSIVVPVFNGEQYIRESLDSILAQTYPNVEIIVMDDASTDGIPSTLTQYADRIRIFRQPTNRGIYGNANDGIAMSRGEFIAVYHAHDVYSPEIGQREVRFLEEHPEAGAVRKPAIWMAPREMSIAGGVKGSRP